MPLPVLSATFVDRDGMLEYAGQPDAATAAAVDGSNEPPRIGAPRSLAVPMSELDVRERLRRALAETGQLFVTPADGLSRVCFTGVGDPACLFVEAVPREVPVVDELDHVFPGCLCDLVQAEEIVRRLFRGEPSHRLAALLMRLRRAAAQAARDAVAA